MRRPKPPQESPETQARRQAAEARADEQRTQAIQRNTTMRSDELLRRFGQRAALAGAPSLANGFGVPASANSIFSAVFGGASGGLTGGSFMQ